MWFLTPLSQLMKILMTLFETNKCLDPTNISMITTTKVSQAITKVNTDEFRHPTLSPDELKQGCSLRWDTWADTSCSGKHAYVDSFVMGKSVTVTGFSSMLGSMKNLPVANVLYAYDTKYGTTLLLEHNNTRKSHSI